MFPSKRADNCGSRLRARAQPVDDMAIVKTMPGALRVSGASRLPIAEVAGGAAVALRFQAGEALLSQFGEY